MYLSPVVGKKSWERTSATVVVTTLELTQDRSDRTSDREAEMRTIEIGFGTRLMIPDSWDAFTFRGFVYLRGADGRFVVRGAWAKKTA